MTTDFPSEPNAVRDNRAAHRFELEQDGEIAVAEYLIAGKVITFTHTKVPPRLEGHGVGSTLVRGALELARERGLRVVARCRFVDAYIREHPEMESVLDTNGRT